MAPQLFDMQLAAGAWGITAATVNQAQAYRDIELIRISAGEPIGRSQHVRYIGKN